MKRLNKKPRGLGQAAGLVNLEVLILSVPTQYTLKVPTIQASFQNEKGGEQ